ncbi:MAG: hypothetical protein JWN95_1418 [Frankiales bacterium]|nr:hypothetical protein [Frankiales bacterium]
MRTCKPCNGRLGATFENGTSTMLKPMLDGRPVVLSRRDQRDIAVWIIKTCMLFHVADRETDAAQGHRARRLLLDLIDSRLPPAQTLIRIFAIDMRDDEPLAGDGLEARYDAPPTAFFSVSTLGSLGWEMALGPTGPILEYGAEEPPVPGLIRIWPPAKEPVRWPDSVVTSRNIAALRSGYVRSSKPGMPAPVVHKWKGPEGA